jgi:hypothetical protein
MTSGPVRQLLPVPFRAAPAELPVVLFRALVVVALADPAVVRFAAVGRGAVRTGVLFAAARAGAGFGAALVAAFGAMLSAAFGAMPSAAFGAMPSAAFGVVLGAAFRLVLSAAFGAVLGAAFGAATTAGVLGSLSVTASCHALGLGTSGELSR